MTKLSVLTYPYPSLKKTSKAVTVFDSRLQDLVRDMFETMYAERGIGLAAAQIGENINVLVMDIGRKDPNDPEKTVPHKIHMVNPKITHQDGLITYEEGCLSCPELIVEIERAQHVTVSSLDCEGHQQTHALYDLEAVCTQHEMDHLKGVLLTDRISRLQREFYGKKRIRERKNENDKALL